MPGRLQIDPGPRLRLFDPSPAGLGTAWYETPPAEFASVRIASPAALVPPFPPLDLGRDPLAPVYGHPQMKIAMFLYVGHANLLSGVETTLTIGRWRDLEFPIRSQA